jgi:CDP-glucose 4,6-dehydratase
LNNNFWEGKKVLITGHTGFKGSWLSIWLKYLGAEVIGISLDPPTEISLYKQANVAKGMLSLREDIRNGSAIKRIFKEHKPQIIFHLAAQALVRYSYEEPVETYEVNVIGTLNILEAIRSIDTVQAAVMATTDKCYKNEENKHAYSETDTLGGHDPYSSSKAAAELLIASYRDSFYPKIQLENHNTAIATVRAGNVIGGGDWAQDRLIPDIIRAFTEGYELEIRNPDAVRPWQHVLDPLSGYIQLAELLATRGNDFAEAWNFGPDSEDEYTVNWIVEQMAKSWGKDAKWKVDKDNHPHEANYLKLNCKKANNNLNWFPKWNLSQSLKKIIEWHKPENSMYSINQICLSQIDEYSSELVKNSKI